jgi:hypothetical protein
MMDTIAMVHKKSLAQLCITACVRNREDSKQSKRGNSSRALVWFSECIDRSCEKSVKILLPVCCFRQSILELEVVVTIVKISVNRGDENSDLARLRQSMSLLPLESRALSIEYGHPHED